MFSFGKAQRSNADAGSERVTSMELADLRGQVKAIGRSLAVIEFGLDGTIQDANKNFLKTTGYTIEEIRGQHHRMFTDTVERESPAYERFWKQLSQGEYQSGQFRRVGKGGREIWLQACYNPIFDPAGKPFKVVKYCTDVTDQKQRAADYEGQVKAIDKSQAVIVSEISTASADQAAGIEQVGRAVSSMDESTQQNAALVEEAAAASESIVQQVRELNSSVNGDDPGPHPAPAVAARRPVIRSQMGHLSPAGISSLAPAGGFLTGDSLAGRSVALASRSVAARSRAAS
jgi:PAS domain S-box-containing protein